jgi:hypothetical protein
LTIVGFALSKSMPLRPALNANAELCDGRPNF